MELKLNVAASMSRKHNSQINSLNYGVLQLGTGSRLSAVSGLFRSALVVVLLYVSQFCLVASTPLKLTGSYIRSDIKEDGSVIQRNTNKFTVELAGGAYRIMTVNSSPALPCVAQGDTNETTVIATGIRVPSTPNGPEAVDLKSIDKYQIVEFPEVQLGGFPGRGQEVLKVLWIGYVGARLYGTNWMQFAIGGDEYSREVAKLSLIKRRILDERSYGVVSNSAEGQFVQSGVLYCDPTTKLSDGSVGILAPPYDKGYPCIAYSVSSWSNGIPKESSFTFRATKLSKDAKSEDDVLTYARYELVIDSIQEGGNVIAPLTCRDKVTRVKDWRALGVDPIIYKITNSQWMALSEIPNIDKILSAKSGIVRQIMQRKAPPPMIEATEKADRRLVARVALVIFAILSLGLPLILWRRRNIENTNT